jgi:hypothetical protein
VADQQEHRRPRESLFAEYQRRGFPFQVDVRLAADVDGHPLDGAAVRGITRVVVSTLTTPRNGSAMVGSPLLADLSPAVLQPKPSSASSQTDDLPSAPFRLTVADASAVHPVRMMP